MTERNTALAVTAAGAVYLILALRIEDAPTGSPWGARLLPVLIGISLMVLGLILVWQHRRPTGKGPEVWGGGLPLVLVVAVVALYALLFDPLGYLLSTAIALLGLLSIYNAGKLLRNAVVAVAFSGIAYLLFHILLGVYLPAGILG